MPRIEADIAVAGAGPAGATVARLLARHGRRVLLIDPDQGGTDRLELLSPRAMAVIRSLGLEDLLRDPAIACPCQGIRRRWASPHVEYDDFLRRPGSQGFVVDRSGFDAGLRVLARTAGVAPLKGRVLGVSRAQGFFELHIQQAGANLRVAASVIVDATGRASLLARRLGARRLVSERLIARRELSEPSAARSHEAWLDVEARSGGWRYAALGPDGRQESWLVERAAHRTAESGHIVNASAACIAHAAGPGWIAIGDAAAAFDPIASQGLVNALSSALVAAGAIAAEGGITPDVAADYSAAMMATFLHSEQERSEVYHGMRGDGGRSTHPHM